jgi:hypothetical protein
MHHRGVRSTQWVSTLATSSRYTPCSRPADTSPSASRLLSIVLAAAVVVWTWTESCLQGRTLAMQPTTILEENLSATLTCEASTRQETWVGRPSAVRGYSTGVSGLVDDAALDVVAIVGTGAVLCFAAAVGAGRSREADAVRLPEASGLIARAAAVESSQGRNREDCKRQEVHVCGKRGCCVNFVSSRSCRWRKSPSNVQQ